MDLNSFLGLYLLTNSALGIYSPLKGFLLSFLIDSSELKTILRELKSRVGIQSAKLLRQLKQKDRLLHKVQKNCDIVTACLQAVSQKRSKFRGTGCLSSLATLASSEPAAGAGLHCFEKSRNQPNSATFCF